MDALNCSALLMKGVVREGLVVTRRCSVLRPTSRTAVPLTSFLAALKFVKNSRMITDATLSLDSTLLLLPVCVRVASRLLSGSWMWLWTRVRTQLLVLASVVRVVLVSRLATIVDDRRLMMVLDYWWTLGT